MAAKKSTKSGYSGHVTDEHIAEAKRGVESKHGLLKALAVEKLGMGGAKTKLRIVIDEGKNRHIRRLFGATERPQVWYTLKSFRVKACEHW